MITYGKAAVGRSEWSTHSPHTRKESTLLKKRIIAAALTVAVGFSLAAATTSSADAADRSHTLGSHTLPR